jgi:glycine betaine/proline transport system ATP-binding protein
MAENVKLSCRNIWKIYGDNGQKLLQSKDVLTDEDLNHAGLIGAVRNANIEIYEGEIFVIMGLSGSGKSTLVRCMSRLIEPTGGEVLFDGQDLLKATDKELIEIRRHKLGMVFQHFALLPHLTVLQNVVFPLTIQATEKVVALKRAQEVIELVGLQGREDNYPRELSGGQQQRVGIARSLLVEPDIWFLDEPFSALDPLIRREMQDEFLRLQDKLKKTIVFITHDFEEALRLADRIAIMKDGKIIQVAKPEELILNPADDYVEEFTRHIPRSKVLTIASILDKDLKGQGEPILNTERVSDVAERVIISDTPTPVVDLNGKVLGAISRKSVAKVLFSNGGNK